MAKAWGAGKDQQHSYRNQTLLPVQHSGVCTTRQKQGSPFPKLCADMPVGGASAGDKGPGS
eukprot:5753778-Heterocapsa_arctica.AAC.1